MKKSFLLLLLTLLPMLVSAYEGESVGEYDNLITGNPQAEMQEVEAGDRDATEARLTGDVNGDGYLSIGDVTTLVEIVVGRLTLDYFPTFADVDGDGELTYDDVSLLVNVILGKSTTTNPYGSVLFYGPVAIELSYEMISYDGGTCSPRIHSLKQYVAYNDGTSGTVTYVDGEDVPLSDFLTLKITSCELQESFEGVSVDQTTGVVTADANLDDSPDIRTAKVLVSGTFNGVAFSQEAMITQDTINKYIWFGYSETTPTEFGSWTHGEQKEASKVYSGAEQAKVQTVADQHATCHWIVIPKDSAYKLSAANNQLGRNMMEIEGVGVEILPTASNAIKDTNHRAYYMWHYTDNLYIQAPTTFVLAYK